MESLTQKQMGELKDAKKCHISEKPFNAHDILYNIYRYIIKHHDHCHLSGKYRDLAHQGCNVNYKESYVIPTLFHNSFVYDSHFFTKALATSFEGKLTLLPVNKEKYLCLMLITQL